MSLHRRNPKRDAVEPAVMAVLEACGWSVTQISVKGGPDLLAGRRGETVLFEVKAEKGTLTDDQAIWHRDWRGAPVVVLRSAEAAAAYSVGQWDRLPRADRPTRRKRTGKTAGATATARSDGRTVDTLPDDADPF
jgi:hypothetical protein